MIELSPDEFRRLGYRAIDLIAERLAQLDELPVRQPVPQSLRDQLMQSPLPVEGQEPDALLEAVGSLILPYPMGNASSRFFAWVNSPPAPLGILGELLAAAHNASSAGGDHAATYVEHGVLNWMKTIMGYPQEAGGILTSGGSVANLIPLAVMRHVKTEHDVRAQGFNGQGAPMTIYTSTQGHSCIEKAVELLGFGHGYLRKIATDDNYRMNIDALRASIQADVAAGLRPVCVVASAGTVNSGAIDPLDAIADVCAEYGLWFHIDGAYGGLGILAEQAQSHYAGLERADSLAIDPHKWLYVPIECGCALVRDAQAMRDAFSLVPPYLRDPEALPWFSEFGIQQTRGFKALKLWLTLQQVGVDGYRNLITHDVAMARMLQSRIRARDDFELMAAGPLSVTCFRYAPPDVNDLRALNQALLKIVQDEGHVFLTSTELSGQLVLRACIVNYRTQEGDLDRLLDTIAEAGERVLGTQRHNYG